MSYELANVVLLLAALLLVSSLTAVAMRKLRFPYTIGLVLVGLFLGMTAHLLPELSPLRMVRLTPNVIMYILLPTLIFEASFNIDSRLLVKNLVPVLALAAPGLVLSTVVVGVVVALLTPLGWGGAMLFGALISATDPVAVITMFKEFGAPKRLTMLVDGESLFNDATAIVMFRVVMGMVTAGAGFGLATILGGTGQFATVFLGGVAFGAVVGYIAVRLTGLAVGQPIVQVAMTTVAAYASFIIADHFLDVSGVMAAMGAGIVMSWYGITRFAEETKKYLEHFWSYAAFVANSFIFLLLGFTEVDFLFDLATVKGMLGYAAIAIAAATVARAAVVYGIVPILGKLPRQRAIGSGYRAVIFWGGLRGAVPLALCFSLDANFAGREVIIGMTLAVVLFTIIIQGLSIRGIISLFKLNQTGVAEKFLSLQAALDAKTETVRRMSDVVDTKLVDEEISRERLNRIELEIEGIRHALRRLGRSPEFDRSALAKVVWTRALTSAAHSFQNLFEHGIISESVFRELRLGAEQEMDMVKDGVFPDEAELLMPLERRIERVGRRVMMKVFPWRRATRKMAINELRARFDVAVAVAKAAIDVGETLDSLSSGLESAAEAAADCRRLFESRRKIVAADLLNLKIEHPKQFRNFQDHVLDRFVARAEDDTLDRLAAIGAFPENVTLDQKGCS